MHLEHCGLLTQVKNDFLNHLKQLVKHMSIPALFHLLEKRPDDKILVSPLRLLAHTGVSSFMYLVFVLCLRVQAIEWNDG